MIFPAANIVDGRKGDDEEVNIDSNGDLGKGLVDVVN